MKKLLSFILVTVIFLSITACSSGYDEVYTYPAKTKSDSVKTTAETEATTESNETTRVTTTKPIVTTTAEETTELAITEPPPTEEPEPDPNPLSMKVELYTGLITVKFITAQTVAVRLQGQKIYVQEQKHNPVKQKLVKIVTINSNTPLHLTNTPQYVILLE